MYMYYVFCFIIDIIFTGLKKKKTVVSHIWYWNVKDVYCFPTGHVPNCCVDTKEKVPQKQLKKSYEL